MPQWHDGAMTYIPSSDLTAAQWIAASGEHWWNMVALGPPGFPAYARLQFIADPSYEGQTENDAVRRGGVLPDDDQLRIAAGTLLRHADSPAEGYLLIWDGWGEEAFPEPVLRTPRVVVPNREYYLCRVPLQDFVSGEVSESWLAETGRPMPAPAFIWPSNRTWCITSDVDPHWAGIGADRELIDQLLAEPRIDVVPVVADQRLPFYS